MSDTMTPTDKLMTVDMLEAIAREVGQMERRHCIGRSQGFDIRDGYAELRAAIEQYGREQFIEGNSAAKLMTEVFDSLSSALEREAAATSKPIEDCVPAPPFDPAAEPPWHRSDMGPAGRGSGEPVAHMWQHPETGLTGFVEHAPKDELQHWERMNKPRKIVMPLYAAPQSREPLTDQQIWDAVEHGQIGPTMPSKAIAVARAIERANGIRSKS